MKIIFYVVKHLKEIKLVLYVFQRQPGETAFAFWPKVKIPSTFFNLGRVKILFFIPKDDNNIIAPTTKKTKMFQKNIFEN